VTVKVSGDERHLQVRAKTPPGVKDVEWFPPATDAETIKDVKVAADGEEWTTIDFTVDRPAGQKASTNLLRSVLAYTTPDGKRTGVIVPIRWSH